MKEYHHLASKFKVFNTLKCQSPFSSILMELGGPCLLPSEGGDVSCWCGEDDICGVEGSHPGGWCGNTAGLSSAHPGSDTRLSWPLVHRLSWAKLSQHKHEHSPEPRAEHRPLWSLFSTRKYLQLREYFAKMYVEAPYKLWQNCWHVWELLWWRCLQLHKAVKWHHW